MANKDIKTRIRQAGSIPADQIDAYICQLETKADLLRYEIEGWCAWSVLRAPVALTLQHLPLVKKDALGMLELLPFVFKDVVGLISLPSAPFLVKSYISALVEQHNHLYKDIFFDDLLPILESYAIIRLVNNINFIPRSKTALTKSHANLTFFRVAANLLARVGGPDYILNLANEINQTLTITIGDEIFSVSWVARILRRFYWYKKLYGWLLDRVQPQYALIADAGEYEFVAAARERNVKVIEFQHGFVSGKNHIAYSWSSYATPYKAKIPTPDRILLYGDLWKQELESNGFWKEELRSVGSLRLDYYRRGPSSTHHDDISPNRPTVIVLTTQGIDTENLTTFLTDFIKLANRPLTYCLYIKLHPVYETSKSPYETALPTDKRVRIILGNERPSTYELLAQADFHLSLSSTCHYEALGFGVPTIILPLATHEIILPLYNAGHAFLAQTPEALLSIILRNQGQRVPTETAALYFKPNALENIKNELSIGH